MSTKIEWCDETINPIRTADGGYHCTKVSEGCTHCYAEVVNNRFGNHIPYHRLLHPAEFVLNEKQLEKPYHWKKPRRIFVQSMGDLFHEGVPFELLGKIFGNMHSMKQHIFMILTKRPERMAEFIQWYKTEWLTGFESAWPREYQHVWLGVTAENQQRADERIPILLQTPAAKRFVSCEPMLGPVDLTKIPWAEDLLIPGDRRNALYEMWDPAFPVRLTRHKLDWIICGGETGPGSRPMHPDWVRSLRDQCKSAEVPFFFKQWGEWTTVYPQGLTSAVRKQTYQYGTSFYGIDKKTAGRSLDGRIWNQYPEVME